MKKPYSESMAAIGKQLQEARKNAGLTQEAAARKISCSVRSLHRYENGRRAPKTEILLAMKDVYQCEFTDLLP